MDKADSSEKTPRQADAKRGIEKQRVGCEGQLQAGVSYRASVLDASDRESQARRLTDTRFPIAQRQALAKRIGLRQGNRHLAAILASRPLSVNPAVPSRVIQRQPLPDIIGQRLASMRFTNEANMTAEGQVVVEEELVPHGERPGRFDGYDHRIQAQSRAAPESNISAVVEDRQRKFHALRSSWPTPARGLRATFRNETRRFRWIWWLNAPGQVSAVPVTGPESWHERVSRARSWWSDWQGNRMPADFATGCRHQPSHGGADANLASLRRCLEAEFVDLLAVALDVDTAEVYVVPHGGRPRPGAVVNFNLELDSRGRGGIGHLPHGRTAPIRRPAVTIGPNTFESESQLSVIATAIHESEHMRQSLEATDLLQQWRGSGSRVDFPAWLARQLGRRRNPITQEQNDMALELWRAEGNAGEVFAYIEGFIRTYPRRPIVESSYRFSDLDSVARFWVACTSEHIRREGIRRLAVFYPTLDQPHQTDFRDNVQDRARRVDIRYPEFWQRVVADVL